MDCWPSVLHGSPRLDHVADERGPGQAAEKIGDPLKLGCGRSPRGSRTSAAITTIALLVPAAVGAGLLASDVGLVDLDLAAEALAPRRTIAAR